MFAVFVAAKLLATLAVLPLAGLVLANSRTIATTNRRPDRWLLRFDVQIALITVVVSTACCSSTTTGSPPAKQTTATRGSSSRSGSFRSLEPSRATTPATHHGGRNTMNPVERAPQPAYRTILVPFDGSHFAAGASRRHVPLPDGSEPPSIRSPPRSQTSSGNASAARPRRFSGPTPTTHASTSRSTPMTRRRPPLRRRPRHLPDLPLHPRARTCARNAHRIHRGEDIIDAAASPSSLPAPSPPIPTPTIRLRSDPSASINSSPVSTAPQTPSSGSPSSPPGGTRSG